MAALQFRPEPMQKAKNLSSIFNLLDELAGRESPKLILLPEMCIGGYVLPDKDSYFESSEPQTGETFQLFSDWCRRNQTAVVYGYCESSNDELFNSQNYISADGSLLATYRKSHLFHFDLGKFTAGEQRACIVKDLGRSFGLGICNDVNSDNYHMRLLSKKTDAVLISACWLKEDTFAPSYWLKRFHKYPAKVLISNIWGIQLKVCFAGRSSALSSSKEQIFSAASLGDAAVIAYC